MTSETSPFFHHPQNIPGHLRNPGNTRSFSFYLQIWRKMANCAFRFTAGTDERTGIQGVEVEKEVGRAWELQCLHCLSTGEHGCKQKHAWYVRNRRVLVSKPLTWFRPEKKTHDTNKAGSGKGSEC